VSTLAWIAGSIVLVFLFLWMSLLDTTLTPRLHMTKQMITFAFLALMVSLLIIAVGGAFGNTTEKPFVRTIYLSIIIGAPAGAAIGLLLWFFGVKVPKRFLLE
jgi:hypothetical protein